MNTDPNVFDADCYLSRYEDVRLDSRYGKDPERHWREHGQAEGRIPGCDPPGTVYPPGFNAYCYLLRYPDVRQNWPGPAVDHYFQHGQAEGRIAGCDATTSSAPVKDSGGTIGAGTATDNASSGTPGSGSASAATTVDKNGNIVPVKKPSNNKLWIAGAIAGGLIVLAVLVKKLRK